jgi:hypothetical protein
MRVLLFQDRFAGAVAAGLKKQTIRIHARCKPGDVLSLRRWSGKPYRSKHVFLGDRICERVLPVVIAPGWLQVDGVSLTAWMAEEFARLDGFPSAADMWDWFDATYRGPIRGELIGWA